MKEGCIHFFEILFCVSSMSSRLRLRCQRHYDHHHRYRFVIDHVLNLNLSIKIYTVPYIFLRCAATKKMHFVFQLFLRYKMQCIHRFQKNVY